MTPYGTHNRADYAPLAWISAANFQEFGVASPQAPDGRIIGSVDELNAAVADFAPASTQETPMSAQEIHGAGPAPAEQAVPRTAEAMASFAVAAQTEVA